ncbi:MBL fold metallo-hydrolase [Pseudoxanthobacter sp.]|uniref:MBL fold metallo-hydrolase n=1 Tax=Pseudoxanthobacter sp. TaxID=1925742 RepID=UPI002FE1B4B5
MVDVTAAPNETPEAVLLTEVGHDLYAASLAGHPTVGAIVGPDGIVLVDAADTPAAALAVAGALRRVTDKPVRKVVLTHYHADATLGAAAFPQAEIITSTLTRGLIADRGRQNRELMAARRAAQGLPPAGDLAPVAPGLTFGSSISLWEGEREVRIMHLGRGHTLGDVVVWVPDAGVMFTGDLTPADRIPDLADGYLRQWPVTLDRIAAFRPLVLVPCAGLPATQPEAVDALIAGTRYRLAVFAEAADPSHDDRSLFAVVGRARDSLLAALPGVGASPDFETLLLVGAARALAEAAGRDQPDVWSVEREQQAREGLSPVDVEAPAFGVAGLTAALGAVAGAAAVAIAPAAQTGAAAEALSDEIGADLAAGLEADLAGLAAGAGEDFRADFGEDGSDLSGEGAADDIAAAEGDAIAAELAEGLAGELAGELSFDDAGPDESGLEDAAADEAGIAIDAAPETALASEADLDAMALAVAQAADDVVASLSSDFDLSADLDLAAEAGEETEAGTAGTDLGMEDLMAGALAGEDYSQPESSEAGDYADEDDDFVARFLAATDLAAAGADKAQRDDEKTTAETRS